MKKIYTMILVLILLYTTAWANMHTPATDITSSTLTFSKCLGGMDNNVQQALNDIDACFGSSTLQPWTVSGNNVYNNNTGNVGIGSNSPGVKLDVQGTTRTIGLQANTTILVPAGSNINTYIAQAIAGDTLLLSSGTYYASSPINVNKSITIRGLGYDQTEIESVFQGSPINILYITADNVMLEDFSIWEGNSGDVAIVSDGTGTLFQNNDVLGVHIAGQSATDTLGMGAIEYINTIGWIDDTIIEVGGNVTGSNANIYGIKIVNKETSTTWDGWPTIRQCHIDVSGENTTGNTYGIWVTASGSPTSNTTVQIFNSNIVSYNASGNSYGLADDTSTMNVNATYTILQGGTDDVANLSSGSIDLSSGVNLGDGTMTGNVNIGGYLVGKITGGLNITGGLTTTGNVGIGSSSPQGPLDVNGEVDSSVGFIIPNNKWYSIKDIYSNGANILGVDTNNNVQIQSTYSTPAITINPSPLSINLKGNVGIGSVSPGASLDVQGTARVNGSNILTFQGH